MWYEDAWYVRFIKWTVEQIKDLLDEYGVKKCLISSAVIIVFIWSVMNIVTYIWNLETDIEVSTLIDGVVVLQEDKKVEVMRTAQMSEGVSITSLFSELATNLSSKAEAIMLFKDLSELCESVNPQKEIILLPEGAGKSSFGEISIYSWNKTGKFLLGNMKFSEIHVVLFMGENYIEAYTYASERLKVNVGVSMGTYK